MRNADGAVVAAHGAPAPARALGAGMRVVGRRGGVYIRG